MKVDKIGARAAALYVSGLSIEDVAAELHVAYRTARKAILSNGVTLRDASTRLVGRTRPDKAPQQVRVPVSKPTWLLEYPCMQSQGSLEGQTWN